MQNVSNINSWVNSLNSFEIAKPLLAKAKPLLAKVITIGGIALAAFVCYQAGTLIIPAAIVNFSILSFTLRCESFAIFKTTIIASLILFSGAMIGVMTSINSQLVMSLIAFGLTKEIIAVSFVAGLIMYNVSIFLPIIRSNACKAYDFISNDELNQVLKDLHQYFKDLPKLNYLLEFFGAITTSLFATKLLPDSLNCFNFYLPVTYTFNYPKISLYNCETLLEETKALMQFNGSFTKETFQKRIGNVVSFCIEKLKPEELGLFLTGLSKCSDNVSNLYPEFFRTKNLNKALLLKYEEVHALFKNLLEIVETQNVTNSENKTEFEFEKIVENINKIFQFYQLFNNIPKLGWNKITKSPPSIDAKKISDSFSLHSKEKIEIDFQGLFKLIPLYLASASMQLADLIKSVDEISQIINLSIIAKTENYPITLDELESVRIKYNDLRKKLEIVYNSPKMLIVFNELISQQPGNLELSNSIYNFKQLQEDLSKIYKSIIKSGTNEEPSLHDIFQKMNSLYSSDIEEVEEEEAFLPGTFLAYPPYNFREGDYEKFKIELNLNSLSEIDNFLLLLGLDSEEKINRVTFLEQELKDHWESEFGYLDESKIRQIANKHNLKPHESFRIIKMLGNTDEKTIKKMLFDEVIKSEKLSKIIQYALKNRKSVDLATNISSVNSLNLIEKKSTKFQKALFNLHVLDQKIAQFVFRIIMAGNILVPMIIHPHSAIVGFTFELVHYVLVRFNLRNDHVFFDTFFNYLESYRIIDLNATNRRQVLDFGNSDLLSRIRKLGCEILACTVFSLLPLYGFMKGVQLSRNLIAAGLKYGFLVPLA
jgi:hypothetical protein